MKHSFCILNLWWRQPEWATEGPLGDLPDSWSMANLVKQIKRYVATLFNKKDTDSHKYKNYLLTKELTHFSSLRIHQRIVKISVCVVFTLSIMWMNWLVCSHMILQRVKAKPVLTFFWPTKIHTNWINGNLVTTVQTQMLFRRRMILLLCMSIFCSNCYAYIPPNVQWLEQQNYACLYLLCLFSTTKLYQ